MVECEPAKLGHDAQKVNREVNDTARAKPHQCGWLIQPPTARGRALGALQLNIAMAIPYPLQASPVKRCPPRSLRILLKHLKKTRTNAF